MTAPETNTSITLQSGKITVLTLVPNSRERIRRCLESVHWADEIFCVVDPNTNDGSEVIAEELATRVITHPYENAAAQRNWALPQINTEWTLVLDADEWVSPELTVRIQKIVASNNAADGYQVKRLSYFFDKLILHCGWHRDYNLRLFRTNKGRYLNRRVHSKIVVEGNEPGKIDEVMYHDTFRNFEEYFTTFQRFTTWGAQDLFERGKRATWADLTLRPWLRFIKMYLFHRGFMDGRHGLVLCGLAAFSVFTKYAKLWNLDRVVRSESKKQPGN